MLALFAACIAFNRADCSFDSGAFFTSRYVNTAHCLAAMLTHESIEVHGIHAIIVGDYAVVGTL